MVLYFSVGWLMVHLLTLQSGLLLLAMSKSEAIKFTYTLGGDKAPDTYPPFFGGIVQNLHSTKCVCINILCYACCTMKVIEERESAI